MKSIVILRDYSPGSRNVEGVGVLMAGKLACAAIIAEYGACKDDDKKDVTINTQKEIRLLKDIAGNEDYQVQVTEDRITYTSPLRFQHTKISDVLMMVCPAGNAHYTFEMLRSSRKTPLLAVPDKVITIDWRYIVFASDLRIADTRQIGRVAALFGSYNNHIQVVHVITPCMLPDFNEDEHISRTKAELNSLGRDNISYRTLTGGDIVQTVIEYAAQKPADIIVISVAQKSWLEKLVSVDHIAHFLKISPVPVLLLPE